MTLQLQKIFTVFSDDWNPRLPSLASSPASPVAGQLWYDSVSNTIKYYNGSVEKSVTNNTTGGVLSVADGGTSRSLHYQELFVLNGGQAGSREFRFHRCQCSDCTNGWNYSDDSDEWW